jgi:hypothetical protein
MNPLDRRGIDHRELGPRPPDSPLGAEREFYRRELERLLAEGHEGKWVLIEGESLVGLFDTEDQALDARAEHFLCRPVLIQQILAREPLLGSLPRYNWSTPDSPHSIHYTQLPPPPAGSSFYTEREFYRREVGRLLAEGHEGKWVLIQGEELVGVFDMEDQALNVRAEHFAGQMVLVQQVLAREPVLLITPRT